MRKIALSILVLSMLIPLTEIAAAGRVETITFTSQSRDSEQTLKVYLPPGYDDGPWSYPVIYGMPGCCGDSVTGPMQKTAEQMIFAGDIAPLIIVQVPTPGASKAYIFNELIPFVDEHFRTLRLRQHRAIYGHSSSGGLGLNLAMARPHIFGVVGSFSPVGGFPAVPATYDAAQYPLRSWVYKGDAGVSTTVLETLGGEYVVDSEGRAHSPGAHARRRFLKGVSKWFGEVPLLQAPRWTFATDEPLIAGESIELRASVYSGLSTDGTRVVPHAIDLSALGGPDHTLLSKDADGVYRAAVSFEVTPAAGLRPALLSFDQQSVRFEAVETLSVYPNQDRILFNDDEAPHWQEVQRVLLNPAATTEVHEGATSLGAEVTRIFILDWRPLDPVSSFAYKQLRFALHPGSVESGYINVDFLGSEMGRASVELDLERREWQIFEIPLDALDPNDQIEALVISGSLQGTFYLDDVRLVHQSPPTAIRSQETVFRLSEMPTQDFAVRAASPPLTLALEAILETPLPEPMPTLSLDLSAVGHTEPVVLTREGKARYTAHPLITPPQFNGIYRLPVSLGTGVGEAEFLFNVRLAVFPTQNRILFADNNASEWEIIRVTSLDPRTTDFVFEGQTSLGVENASTSYQFKWTPPEPVDKFGYTLRFAFHPGDVESGNRCNIIFHGNVIRFINLLDSDSENIGVDLENRDWQLVEIPLDQLELEGPIESIEFYGNLRGSFFLDDIQLVAEEPPPPASTAVVEGHQSHEPTEFALLQNYPNPFNSGTIIRFALPQEQEVDLAVFNMTGQKVATLAAGHRQAGTYAIRWDSRNDRGQALASGVYFYRLRVGDQIERRKLLLLR